MRCVGLEDFFIFVGLVERKINLVDLRDLDHDSELVFNELASQHVYQPYGNFRQVIENDRCVDRVDKVRRRTASVIALWTFSASSTATVD